MQSECIVHYAYRKQFNSYALHNNAYHKQFNSNAFHNYN